jgi:hypothetical protein
MNLRVETYPGYAGAEMVRRFHMGERSLEVVENIDQWHGDNYRYFKVKADDGNLYILRLDESRAEWDLTMFRTQPAARISKSFHQKS